LTSLLFCYSNFEDHGVIGYINYYSAANTTGLTTNVPSIIIIDRWALVVYTILFFAYQIGTLIWMYLVPWKKRRIMFQKDTHSRILIVSRYNNTKATFMDVLRRAKPVNGVENLSVVSNVFN
jgi:hypothetical protein